MHEMVPQHRKALHAKFTLKHFIVILPLGLGRACDGMQLLSRSSRRHHRPAAATEGGGVTTTSKLRPVCLHANT